MALTLGMGSAAARDGAAPPVACAPDEVAEPISGRCAPVVDRRAVPDMKAQTEAEARRSEVPSLRELRAPKEGLREQEQEAGSDIPPPGGIGGGTVYEAGELRARWLGALYTQMLVQPQGLRPTTSGLDWLFTTATNRVEQGVEVVAIYQRWNTEVGELGVFDWSCAPDFPCEGGITQAAWIWVRQLSDFACNVNLSSLRSDHLHQSVYYANLSRKLDRRSPPLWRNEVLLWNYCDDAWDLVYRHDYRHEQVDCSGPTSPCGWWGPILETFPSPTGEPFPRIRELGFHETRLLHDGTWSRLSEDETDFVPLSEPWELFEFVPNRTFHAGNFQRDRVRFEVSPGEALPCIEPDSTDFVTAAILSTADFSAREVDINSLRIGRGGGPRLRPGPADINRDGRLDLVFPFVPADVGLVRGDRRIDLLARLKDGSDIGGIDLIRTAASCGRPGS